MYLLTTDDREPVVWINYARLDPKNINPYDAMGPTQDGEYLYPVAVDMEGEKDRLGLSYVAPPAVVRSVER